MSMWGLALALSLPRVSLPTMTLPTLLSAMLAPIVIGLATWHIMGPRRTVEPVARPDEATLRRRSWIAWEVRGLVIAAVGPLAAGIFFGYLSTDYGLPLMLFTIAGFLAAGLVATGAVHVHR